jgi:hypothetical protein
MLFAANNGIVANNGVDALLRLFANAHLVLLQRGRGPRYLAQEMASLTCDGRTLESNLHLEAHKVHCVCTLQTPSGCLLTSLTHGSNRRCCAVVGTLCPCVKKALMHSFLVWLPSANGSSQAARRKATRARGDQRRGGGSCLSVAAKQRPVDLQGGTRDKCSIVRQQKSSRSADIVRLACTSKPTWQNPARSNQPYRM